MRIVRIFSVLVFIAFQCKSQLSGTLTIPSTSYPSLQSALLAVNSQSLAAGGLTIQIAAGYTETAVNGGFVLSVSGTSLHPLVIRKSGTGPNPLFSAYAGTSTPGSSLQDGIFRFLGCDHVIIDGLSFVDPNVTNPQTMEFGLGFFKTSVTDGCHSNTIRNCEITLSIHNNANGSGPAADGSRGIEFVNATSSAHSTSVANTSPAGSHSFNKIQSNKISGTNYGISFCGYLDPLPYANADHGNEIGGGSPGEGNQILNFGGGGTVNAAAAVKTQGQYDLVCGYNRIRNNDGNGTDHLVTLRGIQNGNAPGANCSIHHNTITLTHGGQSSQVTVIDNSAGANGLTNTVNISNNDILQCGYAEATSGSFSGIANNSSAAKLIIEFNRFRDNSSAAISGSDFLISCSGSLPEDLQIKNNELGFYFNNAAPFTGNLYGIYLSGTANTSTVNVSGNHFQDFSFSIVSSAALYFIYNIADLDQFSVSGNLWRNLFLHTTGLQHYVYNSSSTSGLLSVCDNTVAQVTRSLANGNTYFYYGNATSAPTAVQTFSGNSVSSMSCAVGAGTGNFYGFYNTEGNVSPFPEKRFYQNRFSDIQFQTTGAVYGFYLSDLGDSGNGPSAVHSNTIDGLTGADNVYGIYMATPYSPAFPVEVHSNSIAGLYSSGAAASVYGIYAGANNAGIVCFRNKLFNIASGGMSSIAHGIYLSTVNTATLHTNSVGQIGSSGTGNSRANGIYISSSGNYFLYYNSISLAASAPVPHFGTNALYVSTTASLTLRNNIIINLSVPTGTGICAAVRRSSSNLNSYLSSSDNNLIYAGASAANRVLMYNGSTGYQTLTAYKTAVAPRDNASISSPVTWLSNLGASPNFLHLSPSVSNAVESAATAISQYSLDTDLTLRQGSGGYSGTGTQPDVGADEFELNTAPCSTLSPATLVSSLVLCQGETFSVVAGNITPGSGISNQWQSANSASGNFSNMISGSGIYDIEYISAPMNTTGTFFYRLQNTCGTNSSVAVSNILTVTVLPSPVASIVATSTLVCAHDTLKLQATGNAATVFEWSGPEGYYANGQSVQRSSMTSQKGGVYSLRVQQGLCTAPVQTIQILVSDPALKLFSTSDNLCAGSSATLFATSAANSYTWNTSATTASIIVSPTVATSYSVGVVNALNCFSKASLVLPVTNPTIQGIGAVACGVPGTGTLSAKAFTPSLLGWYSSATSTAAISNNSTYPLTANSNTTFFVQASSGATGTIAGAQSGTLNTEGIMFDLIPQQRIQIQALEVQYSATGTGSFEIWTRTATHLGATTSSSGWNMISSGTVNVISASQLTSLIIPGGLNVLKGQTVALYVVSNSTNQISYAVGSLLGSTFVQNKDVKIKEGSVGPYFNCQTSPAEFCGRLVYSIPGCLSPRVPATLTVSAFPQLIVSSSLAEVCPGKPVILTATGASTYSWTGAGSGSAVTVTPLSNQVFSVTGTSSAGCKSTSTIQVNTLAAPVLSVSPGFTLVCPLQPVSLTVSGASTYTWNTGPNGPQIQVSPVSMQVYTVQGTNTLGCVSAQTIAVGTLTMPVITIQSSAGEICPGEKVQLHASGALSYTWLPSGANSSTLIVNPQNTSVYNAIGLGVNGCTNVAFAMVNVDPCVGLKKNQDRSAIEIYPNPSPGKFVIKLDYIPVRILVLDHLGRKVLHQESADRTFELDLDAVPSGWYTLALYNGSHWQFAKLLRH